jgi:hypothetical protein
MIDVLVILVSTLAPLLPSPFDRDGIALRLHNFSDLGPYLVGEDIGKVRFDLTLVNSSKAKFTHDPFIVARRTRELQISISDPDGKPLHKFGHPHSWPRDPFTEQHRLLPGESSSLAFQFKAFSYWIVSKAGRYRVEGMWTIDGQKYTAPPVEFVVVDVPPEAVLTSYLVPLEGMEALRPVNEQGRTRVEQVAVGKKTLLIYTGFTGASRLAELPGKVELTVEGAFGAGNPMTIKYKDAKSKTGWTTLVINSIGGTPWTEEDERAWIERTTPHIAPAPRPGKP